MAHEKNSSDSHFPGGESGWETEVDVTSLRAGLRAILPPPVSSEFDANVLSALRRPQPWWRLLWRSLAPVAAGGACSFLAVVAVALIVTNLPVGDGASATRAARATDVASANIDNSIASRFGTRLVGATPIQDGVGVAFEAASWDRMLERPDLRDVSMTLMLDGGMRTPPGVRRTKRSPHAPSMTPSGLIPASGDRPRGVGMRFDWVIQDAFAA